MDTILITVKESIMAPTSFRALVVEETPDKGFIRRIQEKKIHDLPKGDVLIKVHYSSLNYKDALSATGNKGVTRRYPHTPGIDAAGTVEESRAPVFRPGDEVLVTGYDLGMNTSGGYGQYIRVPSEWVVPLPSNLDLKSSMVFGTAGFTAGLSLNKLMEAGVKPDDGEILVTGASGGVGSMAVALLARCGYNVVAASGKPEAVEMLTAMGARKVLGRDAVTDTTGKPLLIQRWAACVDTVGGDALTYALRSTHSHGVVTCCGNVASADLHITVYPFILRGVTLIGIDSATTEMPLRRKIWNNFAGPWQLPNLDRISSTIELSELDAHIEKILTGGQMGRRVVRLT
jgi:acrylyl-CoA reductase (NADPH)